MKSLNISANFVMKNIAIAMMMAISANAFAANSDAAKVKNDKNYSGYYAGKPGNNNKGYGNGYNKPGNGYGNGYNKPGNGYGNGYNKPGKNDKGYGNGKAGFFDNGFGPKGPSYKDKKKYMKKGFFFDAYGNMFKFDAFGKKVYFNKYGKVIYFVNKGGFVFYAY